MGSVVLDSGVIIGFFNANDAHHIWSVTAMRELVAERHTLVISTVSVAEVLVRPTQAGSEADVLADLHALRPAIVEVDERIAVRAAELRGRHGALRLPDALVMATALATGSDLLVTTDAGIARTRIPELQVRHPE